MKIEARQPEGGRGGELTITVDPTSTFQPGNAVEPDGLGGNMVFRAGSNAGDTSDNLIVEFLPDGTMRLGPRFADRMDAAAESFWDLVRRLAAGDAKMRRAYQAGQARIVGAASDHHREQMAAIAAFSWADAVEYADLGNGEDYTLTKGRERIVLRVRGNRADGGFLSVEAKP